MIESHTVDEVAEALKIHPYTVRRLCREGKLPCFKIGGQWRFRKKKLAEWCENQCGTDI
ncbi:MAG: helix-turn-helix domain-containing protein [Candidatus Omnitrophica bacterium]|nr:helix-turn-helix domain-containing protein [Candidatus Omnitrophota bacterium]MCG2710814.1 helix-turn-helix domain-containing protein [Candidatus Omnitrophota bacterium]